MSEEEIKDILNKFTKDHFEIVKIDRNNPGETIAIIKFDDIEGAEKFLTALSESSDSAKDS